jgi:hypothetical protein
MRRRVPTCKAGIPKRYCSYDVHCVFTFLSREREDGTTVRTCVMHHLWALQTGSRGTLNWVHPCERVKQAGAIESLRIKHCNVLHSSLCTQLSQHYIHIALDGQSFLTVQERK